MEIPPFKKGKRLYFKKSELFEWIYKGTFKTITEIEMEAINYIMTKRKT